MKYAEVVVDRHIVKRDRRAFIDTPEDADVLFPEVEAGAEDDGPNGPASNENPLALTFHYHIPAALRDQLRPGHLVAVPFRKLVLALDEASHSGAVDEMDLLHVQDDVLNIAHEVISFYNSVIKSV